MQALRTASCPASSLPSEFLAGSYPRKTVFAIMTTSYSLCRRQPAARRGAVLVELVVVLLLLLTVLLAAVDLGRFTYFYIAVTHAAGAGARYASFHPVTTASAPSYNAATRQVVLNDMQGVFGYQASRMTVSDPLVTQETDSYQFRRVRVTAIYDFRTLINWPGLPAAVNLTRSVEMRVVR